MQQPIGGPVQETLCSHLVPLLAMLSPPAIVAIVLLALLFAGYSQWLKTQQSPAGASQDLIETLEAVEQRLAKVEQAQEALSERVQNLETIVTSEAWIAQHEASNNEGELSAPSAEELTLPPESDSDPSSIAEHTAEIARRLRSNDPTNGNL